VINSCGIAYFNNTAAYAVAYAVHIGVKKISMYGCDYTYPNAHDAEKGRACTEFHLGIAKARGIRIGLTDKTSLMDAMSRRARSALRLRHARSRLYRRRRRSGECDLHAARDAADRRRNRSALRSLQTPIPSGEGIATMTQASDANIAAKIQHLNNGDSLVVKSGGDAYEVFARTGTTSGATITALSDLQVAVATAVAVTAASTSATEFVTIFLRGIMRINAAGTIIPQIQASAQPGLSGTPGVTVLAGSYFRCWPLGVDTVASAGNWS
jgi:hypothetical protein